MIKIKWSIIAIICIFLPFIGVAWLIYEVWSLHSNGKLTTIFQVIEGTHSPKYQNEYQGSDIKYRDDEVNRFKKIVMNQEDFWDPDLPIDFCIAYRTREILIHRKIVDDFLKSKIPSPNYFSDDHTLQTVWQSYFQNFVTSEASIARFWAIFIDPSASFVESYTKLDQNWYPKVIESQSEETELEGGALLNEELIALFRKYRNRHYWAEDKDWEWFFFQYLTFLTKNKTESECQLGMQFFIFVIAEMQNTLETSGWVIDYGLYDNPLEAWYGQTLLSKIKSWMRGRNWARDVKRKLPYF